MSSQKDISFQEYDKKIQLKIENKFNQILPASIIVCWVSAVAIFSSPIPKVFFYLNFVVGIIFMVLHVYRKEISIEMKIYTTIFIPYIMGIISFLDGGFKSSGIILLLIANIIAVMLFAKKKSRFFSFISILTFLALWVYTKNSGNLALSQIDNSYWIVKFVVFLLFILIFNVIVFSIREYLIKSIFDLENSLLKIEDLAYYDQLTKLPNFYYMQKGWESSTSLSNGLFMIVKLKDLNIINSIYGNDIGDKVLVELGNKMLEIKDQEHIVARSGGNEFAIWMPGEGRNIINDWLSALKKILKKDFNELGMSYRIDFLIGYTICKKERNNLQDCLQKAQLAMTYAKNNKNSDIVAYDQNLANLLQQQEKLKDLLMEALQNKDFNLYYQTKVDIEKDKVIGVEALARWHHDDLGFTSPAIFVPLIESMNMYEEFGIITIEKAFQDYQRLCEKYKSDELSLAINISPSFLLAEKFLPLLIEKASSYQIKPGNIILEITEEVILQGTSRVNNLLYKLQKEGFIISLDDFGTGFSSLNYLMEYNIDELKIDRTFLKNLCNNVKTITILESIEYIARSYKLNIVIEGVETDDQLQILKRFDFKCMQGYFFSYPQPL